MPKSQRTATTQAPIGHLPLLLGRLVRRAHLLGDFLAVARAGGIRQAADRIHVTQSALTRRIQELERTLEVTLFERSAQGMTPTPIGEALRHHAEMVEMNCTYAATEIAQLLSGAAGELRIAAGPAWAYEIAPDAVAATKRQLPDVRISLIGRMTPTTLDMLDAGQVDVALGALPEAPQRSAGIEYEGLLDVEHLVFASQSHPLKARRAIDAATLARHPWVWFSEALAGRERVRAWLAREGVTMPSSSVETSSVHFGFRILADARHLMLLPSTLRTTAARHGLAPLRLRTSIGSYAAGLMFRPSLMRLRAFSVFRAELMRAAANADAPHG